MPARIFVYLPAGDLRRSVEFFTTLGYAFGPQARATASRTHVATKVSRSDERTKAPDEAAAPEIPAGDSPRSRLT